MLRVILVLVGVSSVWGIPYRHGGSSQSGSASGSGGGGGLFSSSSSGSQSGGGLFSGGSQSGGPGSGGLFSGGSQSGGPGSGGLFSSSPQAGDSTYGYGPKAELKCAPYYDTVYENKCQSYTDRVCTTQHQENCYDVPGENCKAILASKQVRKCFNVTELLCSLKEDVDYEVIQAAVTVQNCQRVNERVCDTVYKAQFTNKDDYKCIELANVNCIPQDKVIQDKTCKTVTEFDCKEVGGSAGDMIDEGFDGSGARAGGGAFTPVSGAVGGFMAAMGGSVGGSGAAAARSMGGFSSGQGGGGAYGSYPPQQPYGYKPPSYGYEEPKVVCKKSTATKCYNTPRSVSSEKCERKKEKKCEKFAERTPFPVEKQHCHNEEKKMCELETRQQPKQVKKYVYSKQCRPIRRTICENADVKDLVQSCAPYTHKSCSYTPREKCVDVPKEHCYKVAKKVQKQKCETVVHDNFGSSSSGASSDFRDSVGSSAGSGSFGSSGSSFGSGGSSGSSFGSGGSSSSAFGSGGSSAQSFGAGGSFDSSPAASFSSADAYGAGDFSPSDGGFASSDSFRPESSNAY